MMKVKNRELNNLPEVTKYVAESKVKSTFFGSRVQFLLLYYLVSLSCLLCQHMSRSRHSWPNEYMENEEKKRHRTVSREKIRGKRRKVVKEKEKVEEVGEREGREGKGPGEEERNKRNKILL